MRAACALCVFQGILLATSTVGAEQFPYKAYVNANNVYIRSGPGKNYYPTDKLQRGAEVEVYRHDPGGWYAVRPPADSYSWIPGGEVNVLEDNLAEVVQQDVVVYVGSKFSDVHDVRQVRLEPGEVIEILGEKRVVSPDNGTAETWYKIAPPRGEFRWVFGRFVVPQGIAGTQAEHADPSELAGVRHRGPRAKDEADVAQAGGEKRADETRSIVRGVAAEQVAIPTAAYEGDRPGIALTSAQTSSSQADEGGLVYSTTRPRGRRMSAVEKLDGDLSLIVADPPAKWDFHTIRTRAQAALENSASALERGKAKELLSDIERYEQLQAGYAQIDAIRDETEQQNRLAGVAQAAAPGSATAKRPASAVPETVPATLASGATSDVDLAQFDGVGQLRPVVSRRAGAPRFALTGTAGEVLMFLTATPGVNLDQYVGQYVGLNGTRGYMPKLNQAHLTVARARPLASSILVARQP